MRIVPHLLLLTFFLAAHGFAGDQAVDLRPIWKAGQTSRYQISQTELTAAQMQGLGEPQRSTTQVEAVVAWEVVAAEPSGGGTARLTIESISFEVTGEDGQTRKITAQASDEEFQSMRQYIAALSGSAVTVAIGSDGQISSVEGHEAIREKAGEAGENLDEGFFRDLARDLAVLTGGQASVQRGMKWQHTHTSDHPIGELRQSYIDELLGVEVLAGVPVAAIRRRGELALEPDLSERPADAPPLNIRTTEATYDAQLFFDLSRHELIGSHAQQTLALEVTITTPAREFVQSIREVTSTQVLRISER